MPPIKIGSRDVSKRYVGTREVLRVIIGGADVLHVDPSTTAVPYASASGGLAGHFDTARTAGRTYGLAGGQSAWVGYITGTDATITLKNEWGNTTAAYVTIDGGAEFSATHVGGGVYTLFSGQQQKKRLVCVRLKPTLGTVGYFDSTVALLSITGAPPSFKSPTQWISSCSQTTPGVAAGGMLASLASSGYVPDKTGSIVNSQSSMCSSLRFRTSDGGFFVYTLSRYIAWSVDRNAPAIIDTGNSLPKALYLQGAAGSHDYSVSVTYSSGGGSGSINEVFVGVDSYDNTMEARRFDQYGASSTYGAAATSPLHTDVYIAAAKLGFAGDSLGVSGQTIAQVKARIPANLAGKTVTANDVAVLQLGRNDVGGWNSTTSQNYKDCINLLLAAGYGKVICRNLRRGGTDWSTVYTTENAAILQCVTDVADSRVVYLDTTAWSGFEQPDGVHMTDAGYLTFAGFVVPAYADILGIAL